MLLHAIPCVIAVSLCFYFVATLLFDFENNVIPISLDGPPIRVLTDMLNPGSPPGVGHRIFKFVRVLSDDGALTISGSPSIFFSSVGPPHLFPSLQASSSTSSSSSPLTHDVTHVAVLYPSHEEIEPASLFPEAMTLPLELTLDDHNHKSASLKNAIFELSTLRFRFPESEIIGISSPVSVFEFRMRIQLYLLLEFLLDEWSSLEMRSGKQSSSSSSSVGVSKRRVKGLLTEDQRQCLEYWMKQSQTKYPQLWDIPDPEPAASAWSMLEMLEVFLRVVSSERSGDLRNIPLDQLWIFHFPLARFLVESKRRSKAKNRPFIVGINGFPGVGKTTLNRILNSILKFMCEDAVLAISIDDFYFTQEQRRARNITQWGLPSQDLGLLHEKLEEIRNLNSMGKGVSLPKFDKSVRRRCPENTILEFPTDFVLLEGMNVGCVEETQSFLDLSISLHADVDLLYGFKYAGVRDDLLKREDFTEKMFAEKFTKLWRDLIGQYNEFMPAGNRRADILFQVGIDHVPVKILRSRDFVSGS